MGDRRGDFFSELLLWLAGLDTVSVESRPSWLSNKRQDAISMAPALAQALEARPGAIESTQAWVWLNWRRRQ